MAALIKLFAQVIACKSPVKWRLIAFSGSMLLSPPPQAPPFLPNTGPKEGSRRTTMLFLPNAHKESVSPILIVVFPSP